MGIAGLVAALAGRPGQRWYALLLAAAVTLALNPRAPEEPGWQLSFVAVAALLAGAPPLRAAFARRHARAGGGRGRDHDRRDARDGTADGAALPAGLARGAAGEPAGGAGDRARDVARRARLHRRSGHAGAGGAVHRAHRPAARVHPAGRAPHRGPAARHDRGPGRPARDPRRLGRAGGRRRDRVASLAATVHGGVEARRTAVAMALTAAVDGRRRSRTRSAGRRRPPRACCASRSSTSARATRRSSSSTASASSSIPGCPTARSSRASSRPGSTGWTR